MNFSINGIKSIIEEVKLIINGLTFNYNKNDKNLSMVDKSKHFTFNINVVLPNEILRMPEKEINNYIKRLTT